MKLHRWLALGFVGAAVALAPAQTPAFTRPGTIIVAELIGEATATTGVESKALKLEDRLRAEVVFKTARRSTMAVEFGNGTLVKLGSDSELAVDEFWQQPHSMPGKSAEWKEEPSPSLTRLRLPRGDATFSVKPLKVNRGSAFTLELVAGTLRLTQGTAMARVQMTDVGLGVCVVELREGAAEFELVGGSVAPMPAGRRFAFAVEVDRKTGAVKVGEMPKPDPAGK